MQYSEFVYIDTAVDGVNHRNNVIDITKFKAPIGQTDCYRTVFRFNENYLKHFQTQNTVRGFRGTCYADWLPIDIDSEDLNNAYKKTKESIEILKLNYDIDIKHIFFSGAKGFHILLPSQIFGFKPNEKLPVIFKNIATDMLSEYCDLAIYDINRLFRLTNTINSKSGLYKIPLTITQFNRGLDAILGLAKQPQKSEAPPFYDFVLNPQLSELYHKYLNAKSSINSSQTILGAVPEGQRNVTATRLTGILRAKDIDQSFAWQILQGWNKGNISPLDEKELCIIFESVYRYKNKQEELEKDIYPVWAVYDEYREFAQSDKKVNLGIPEIDKKIRGIRPGQVLTIMGFTGNLKSATLQNFMIHYLRYSKEPVLMFEMEMSRLDIFERAIQISMNIEGSLIEQIFRKGEDKDCQAIIDTLRMEQKDFYIVDIPALDFDLMVKYVRILEEKFIKKKLGLIGIDFLQLMVGSGESYVQKVDAIAKGMKEFAKRTNIPVIAISQVTNIADKETPIKLMDARDSKTISQMSDYVIGIWEEEEKQVLAILKNRKGGLGKVYRTVDTKSLTFKEIDKTHKDLF